VGGIRTQFSTEINLLFSLESLKTFEQFQKRICIDPEFRRIGYLFLATSPTEIQILNENFMLLRKYDIPVEVLNGDEIERRWPYLRTDDIIGEPLPPGWVCGPSEVLSGFVSAARRAG